MQSLHHMQCDHIYIHMCICVFAGGYAGGGYIVDGASAGGYAAAPGRTVPPAPKAPTALPPAPSKGDSIMNVILLKTVAFLV